MEKVIIELDMLAAEGFVAGSLRPAQWP